MAVEYSKDEIQRMQQDAVKRVNEMRQRSKAAIDHTPPLVSNAPTPNFAQQHNISNSTIDNPAENAPLNFEMNTHEQPENDKGPIGSILSRFLPSRSSGVFDLVKNNSDTIILMAILAVLYTEEADELLLLAIIYIMI